MPKCVPSSARISVTANTELWLVVGARMNETSWYKRHTTPYSYREQQMTPPQVGEESPASIPTHRGPSTPVFQVNEHSPDNYAPSDTVIAGVDRTHTRELILSLGFRSPRSSSLRTMPWRTMSISSSANGAHALTLDLVQWIWSTSTPLSPTLRHLVGRGTSKYSWAASLAYISHMGSWKRAHHPPSSQW